MTTLTTIKVTTETRDMLKAVAAESGVTIEQALRAILRRDWLRRLGERMSEPMDDEDRLIIDGSTVAANEVLATIETGSRAGR